MLANARKQSDSIGQETHLDSIMLPDKKQNKNEEQGDISGDEEWRLPSTLDIQKSAVVSQQNNDQPDHRKPTLLPNPKRQLVLRENKKIEGSSLDDTPLLVKVHKDNQEKAENSDSTVERRPEGIK